MIKNSKQAAASKIKLDELKASLAEYESQDGQMNPIKFKLGVRAFQGMIKDLEIQLQTYEELITQNVNEFDGLQVPYFAKFLISARLSRRMSQKELGEKIGVHEQQIQRYEQDDYVKTSWGRLMEIYKALSLKVNLEKIVLVKKREAKIMALPNGISKTSVERASSRIKSNHSLFQNAI